jgi:D-sedoheptulose 7-phosphate isomerase
MNDDVVAAIDESIRTKEMLKQHKGTITKIGFMVSTCINRGGTIFIFGNGGSAADSQHIAAELVGRYQKKRRGLPALAFTTNTSTLTAIGNDFGYEFVFQRQVESMVTPDDLVIGISTSGNSPNVINGIAAAKKIGAATVGLAGSKGGKLGDLAEVTLKVPSDNTQRIQECHILIGHIICDIVEKNLDARFSDS